MKKIRKRLFSILLCATVFLSGCSGGDSSEGEETTTDDDGIIDVTVTDAEGNPVTDEAGNVVTSQVIEKLPEDKPLNVGFIYGSDTEGDNLAQSLEIARLQSEKTLGANTYYIENVLVSQFGEACAKLIEEKECNVIVACGKKFDNAAKAEAEANGEVYYMVIGGNESSANLSSFQGAMYQPAYVAGMTAAYNSDTNTLGIVADLSVNNCYGIIDGFIQGAKELTDKNTDVRLNWAWGNKDNEIKAAIDDLVRQGCDVIFTCSYSNYAIEYCEEKGVKVIGMAYNTPELAPEHYLTGCFYNLSTYLVDMLRGVRYDTASANIYREGLSAGAVRLTELGPACREGTEEIFDALYQLVTKNNVSIFTGEIKDNLGNIKVEKGATLTHEEIWEIGWLEQSVTHAGDFTEPVTDPVPSELNIIGEPLEQPEV